MKADTPSNSFASLRILAGFDLQSLADEFSVDLADAYAWDRGDGRPPPGLMQCLQILAKFSADHLDSSAAMERKPMPTPKLGKNKRILSFFTGGGGLDLGFEAAGFETAYATDIDSDSCDTLRINVGKFLNTEVRIEQADIRKIDPQRLPRDIDLIIGGPPCQSFSASGRRAGGASGRLDDRGTLFEAYCKVIEAVQPSAFIFENVRGILATNRGEDWKAIVATFARIGYKISYRVLDALDYGAPQQRERMFLVGHRLPGEFLFPEPTHGPDSVDQTPHRTAGQALAEIAETENLAALALKTGKYSHLLPLVPPGSNYLHFTAKRGYPKPIFAYRSRFSDFLYKASPDLPVKTVIASPGKYTGPLHWDNRYFSISEYKRLQGFPDDYRFAGNRQSVIRQIGNSVSPHISYRLALAVAQQIFGAASTIRLLESGRRLSFDARKGAKAQATRVKHSVVAKSIGKNRAKVFWPQVYQGPVVTAQVGEAGAELIVRTDQPGSLFAKFELQLDQGENPLGLTVSGYGTSPETVQAMWNAVDEWVQCSSGFHSLFELYGHFTEPHPVFTITSFHRGSDHPIAKFAAHAASFKNCSRYFPKRHLIELFEEELGTSEFVEIAKYLRRYRFDIRSRETNIAIDKDSYMVAYPFTLPFRRQMNFMVRNRDAVEVGGLVA